MRRLLAVSITLCLVAYAAAEDEWPFEAQPVASFDEPWAMAFLPDGRLLVTEKPGRLLVVTQSGEK